MPAAGWRPSLTVGLLGLRQRAKGPAYFIEQYRSTGDRHALGAAELHSRHLRERTVELHRELVEHAAGVRTTHDDPYP